MTKQIAVRLPDDLVEYLDSTVRAGTNTSRADAVAKALARERRRDIALRDAAIYAEQGDYPDLEMIAAHTSANPASLD